MDSLHVTPVKLTLKIYIWALPEFFKKTKAYFAVAFSVISDGIYYIGKLNLI